MCLSVQVWASAVYLAFAIYGGSLYEGHFYGGPSTHCKWKELPLPAPSLCWVAWRGSTWTTEPTVSCKEIAVSSFPITIVIYLQCAIHPPPPDPSTTKFH